MFTSRCARAFGLVLSVFFLSAGLASLSVEASLAFRDALRTITRPMPGLIARSHGRISGWEERADEERDGQRLLAVPLARRSVGPAFAVGKNIVIGHGQEVVIVTLVPVGDHLGKVVAVAPQRVRVQVALPPARFGGVESGGGEEKWDQQAHRTGDLTPASALAFVDAR